MLSTMRRTTVVLPDPDPPATPMTKADMRLHPTRSVRARCRAPSASPSPQAHYGRAGTSIAPSSGMTVRRPGSVQLTDEQLLDAIGLLNAIEHSAAELAGREGDLDEFVANVRVWVRELRALFRTPATPAHARLLQKLLAEVAQIDGARLASGPLDSDTIR